MCTPDGSGVRETRDLVGDLVAAAERLWRNGRAQPSTSGDLRRLRRACNLIELEFSRRASAFAQSGEWELHGHVSAVAWMRDNCKMTNTAAATSINIGAESSRLPLSFAALERGQIGLGHVSMMATTLSSIGTSPDIPVDERLLLEKAEMHSIAQFRHDCDHLRHAADEKGFLESHLAAAEARNLQLKRSETGCYTIRAFLDPEGGATVRTALEALARRSDGADDRKRNRRLADALVELSHHGLDAGVVPMQQMVRPHLQLTVSLETLAALRPAPAAELEHSTPIPSISAQRLACDATVRRIVVDAQSAVLDVGRAQRIANPAQRSALMVRDQGCIWPGCDRPPSWTAAHHLKHWAQHGGTELGNLVLVCHRHHRMVHEGGWQLAMAEDGQIVATRIPVFHLQNRVDDLRDANRRLQAAATELVAAANSAEVRQQARGPDASFK